MEPTSKSTLSIVMGVIIIVADLYWTYTSYPDLTWVALGVIILLASVVWIWLDLSLRHS